MPKYYDEYCNHCGKSIHPLKVPIFETDGARRAFLRVHINDPVDCVYLERHRQRNFFGHPLTNFICLECNHELTEWLQAAGVQ